MPSRVTPAASSAAIEPVWSRSVTKSWYFDTTMATRRPLAAGLPSIVRIASSSTSPERRLALLEKGGGALAHIDGSHYETEERGFKCRPLRKRHFESAIHGVENVSRRNRSVAC